MNDSVWVLTADTLARIFVILVYGSAGLTTMRWIRPRLSLSARRLACLFFVAQLLVIVAALTIEPATDYERWLWDLDQERNIPATLASIQLAMVGAVAIAVALSKLARPSWLYRLYLIAFGWLFLHLARDEYYGFHEFRPEVRIQYAVLGAAAILITLLIGWKSPGHKRVWGFLIASGVTISAFGAYVLEQFRSLCIRFFLVDGCIWSFHYEETLEFLGIWLVLVAMLGHFSQASACATLVRLILYLFPLLFALSLMTPFLMNLVAYRYMATPVEVTYEADMDITLQAYRLERRSSSLNTQLFLSASSWHAFSKLGYSVHLVDQVTGNSQAGADKMETRRQGWRIALYDSATRYIEWITVDTSSVPTDRALWAVLTLWRESGEDYVRQVVRASSLPLLSDTEVILGEFVLPGDAPATPSSTPLALFDSGYALGSVAMPERAKAGEPLDISFAWSADSNGREDLIQFLHIGQSDTGEWRVFDQFPLGTRLPPRLWYAGMSDVETWQVPLSANLAPGRYTVFTGLYSASNQTRVAVTDAAGTPWPDNRVALGSLIVE